MPVLTCPRDKTNLSAEKERGIAVDACPTCHGAWYDFAELRQLEETVTRDESDLAGTIEYAKNPGELTCPVCAERMTTFNYRGNPLELDACPKEHGFWLDAGEAQRVREFMEERSRGLRRAGSAQRTWDRNREGGFRGGFIDRLLDRLRGR